jgi:hypothetical protein
MGGTLSRESEKIIEREGKRREKANGKIEEGNNTLMTRCLAHKI